MTSEQRVCRQCGQGFSVGAEDRALLEKLSPVIGEKKYALPPPTLCFDCRLQRRLAFYNARSLYRRMCQRTNKPMVSVYSPGKPFTVYHKDAWYSDTWDPLAHGRAVDFSQPFFPQFRALMEQVPYPNIAVLSGNENSEYTNDNYKTKDSYLVFDGERAQNCYYGHTYTAIKDCVDFLHIMRCELCYECIHCYDCYALRYSRYCSNCSDSWFLRDCTGCKNCFGCANLRQKQYCIFNEQKTKEEYDAFIARFESTKHSAIRAALNRAEELFRTYPVKALRGEKNEQCVGDNLNHCKDCYGCYDSNEHRETRYCTDCLLSARDCMDVHIGGDNLELAYENCVVGARARSLIGCYYVTEGVENIFYSLWCSRSSNNLFGCIGLRHKQYCILNKQYTKEEYVRLAGKLVEHMQQTGEWGEFFPHSLSMFGYNETMAQTFFPLAREEVFKRGWQWCDEEAQVQAIRSIPAARLPDDTGDVPDDVLEWAILCEVTGKPYKIIKQELEFYRSQGLPIPRRHPDQRHIDRFAMKNPYRLWSRTCAQCGKGIETTYSPDRPEIVFCETCYLKEVY